MRTYLRRSFMGLLAIGVVASTVWVRAQVSDGRPVASLLPPGALLYLEAKDFHRLLTEWNGSGEKKRWLGSKNFQQLSISRLIQRLAQANGEFETAAGLPIGMTFTDQMAGTRSGFAFYNFGDVAFVYLTQMPQTSVESSDLWRKRAGYQSRDSGGVPFYVKADAKSGRKVAFAAYKGWFVVATDEGRMAQTLVLLAGGKGPALSNEQWFATAAAQRKDAGDLRLIYDMPALLQSPQYRTYWLHRNGSELKPFVSGIADLFEREDGFIEERVMVRKTEAAVTQPAVSLAEVAGYSPASASSLLRAWESPEAAQIGTVVQQVVLGEATNASPGTYEPAPNVTPEAGAVGSESDLEIRIDELPFRRPSQQTITPLVNALVAMQPLAMAHVQVTTVLSDQVFVMPQSAVVLLCQKPDRTALDQSLAQVSNGLQTGSLDPLTISVQGRVVTLSRVPLTRADPGIRLDSGATYLALYDHRSEWPRYKKLFGVLDQSVGATQPGFSPNTPAFFSGNLESLGDSLSRLQRASVVSSDTATTIRETVRYQLSRP